MAPILVFNKLPALHTGKGRSTVKASRDSATTFR
jgi:hypothetical protein